MSSLTALESLVSMGFPKEKAEKALSVNKGNIDASIEWIMNNPDDGNNGGGNSNSSSTTTTTTSNSNDTNDNNDNNDTKSTSETNTGSSPKVVKSYKCVETGRLFRSYQDMQIYAERTGRTNFEESSEEKKPLTKEEMAAAQEKLKQKIVQKRKEREEDEKKRKIEAEKKRREGGKSSGSVKEEMLKRQKKRDWDLAKKEKQAQKLERERLRREIARDKAERLARNGKLSGKLSVDGYKPSGQDMKAMSRAMDEQDKLLKEAGIRKKEPKKALPPAEQCAKATNILSKLKAGNVGMTALKTAFKMLSKIIEKPTEGKFRNVNLANENFKKRISGHPGGIGLMQSAGFIKNVNENTLTMSDEDALNKDRINMVISKIQETMGKM